CPPARDRTEDLLLKRELLYQLSYGRKFQTRIYMRARKSYNKYSLKSTLTLVLTSFSGELFSPYYHHNEHGQVCGSQGA
ncbi:MAG: hypothetical protein UY30_C0008G0008, partial [Parcubacteria group bacterium GW2011_GWB1_48_6]